MKLLKEDIISFEQIMIALKTKGFVLNLFLAHALKNELWFYNESSNVEVVMELATVRCQVKNPFKRVMIPFTDFTVEWFCTTVKRLEGE